MTDNNAAFIQYADLRNKNWSLQERLNVEGIYVSSRDELVSAQDFIINTLKRPTIVRFAAPFATRTAPKTDINVGFVYLDGNGVSINAIIPNGTESDHNYFLRCYTSSGALDNNVPIRPAPILKDFTVKGIGAKINKGKDETPTEYNYTDGIRFHSPEGPLGNFSVNNVYVSGFYYGLYYGTNAYIAHHYACEVIRCFESLHMPSTSSGAQNFGEGINFFGGTLGNSGVGRSQRQPQRRLPPVRHLDRLCRFDSLRRSW